MIEFIYPATPSQQGFLLGGLSADPEEGLYVEQFSVPLIGALDVDRFNQTWRDLVARHEILRTAFALNISDEPRQVVLVDATLEIEFFNSEGCSLVAQDEEVQRIKKAHRSEPFDLKRPPLLRLALQRRTADEHILVWSHNHAILDGWSQAMLLDEMLRLYHRDEPPSGCPSFGKYASWQSERPTKQMKDYWRRALRHQTPSAKLPTLSLAPKERRFNDYNVTLPQPDTTSLGNYARAQDLTIAGVLISLWGLIMGEFRGTGKDLIGVTMSGRSEEFPRSSEIFGPFVNSVPLAISMDVDTTFADFAQGVTTQLADATRFGDSSAGQIHQWLDYPKAHPLFESVIAIGNYPIITPAEQAANRHLQLDPEKVDADGGRTFYPISIVVSGDKRLTIRFVHQRDRVETGTAIELLDRFYGLIQKLAASQGPLRISELMGEVRLRQPCPNDATKPALEKKTIASENEVVSVVCRSFERVLRSSRIDQNDSFIEEGGYSILAIELLQVLRSQFNVDLTLQDLLLNPTPSAISRLIRKAADGEDPPNVQLPEIEGSILSTEPFPLTEIQQAYWVGRQSGFELSSVDPHLYAEVEVSDIDLDRLENSWQLLIERHAMLCAIFTHNATQQILSVVPKYRIRRHDLRNVDDLELPLNSIRERLSQIRRSIDKWPLFSIEAAILPKGKTRLYLSFDLLIGDAMSWKILYSELVALYQDPAKELPPIELNYRDFVDAQTSLKSHPQYESDKAYWKDRLDTLPPPPRFPLLRPASKVDNADRFHRRESRLDAQLVALLREKVSEIGVTPSALMLSIFAEVIAKFTGQREFLLNLTVFNRHPIHRHINQVVGNFTSLSMTEVHAKRLGQSFSDCVRLQQQQLWRDLDHRLYSGVAVLRDLAQKSGDLSAAKAPVVFTSTLDFSPSEPPSNPWELVHGIGLTPQVLLDYQTFGIGDEVAIIWDSVDACFPDGFLDAMFQYHEALLRSFLLNKNASIDSLMDSIVPAWRSSDEAGPKTGC